MKKMIEPFVVFVLTFLLGGVGFLCYLAYRLVEETVTVIDRTWGAAFYQVIGAAALFSVVLVLTGSAIYVVKALGTRARRIYARDGLFPVIDQGSGQFANLNERGAQTLAALGGAAGRVSAPTVGRVIDMHYRQPEPTALPEPAPVEALHFPRGPKSTARPFLGNWRYRWGSAATGSRWHYPCAIWETCWWAGCRAAGNRSFWRP